MIDGTYNLILVLGSYIISVFGSYTALNLAIRIPTASGSALIGWLLMAATAIGGGAIWSMHFIGMLAFDMNMAVSYDIGLTIGSLILAIAVCAVGLFIVGRGVSGPVKLVSGGVVTGLGVAGMHYTGMAAMKMPATISYDMPLFYTSIAIAIVAATAALWLAFNLRGNLQRFGSAFIMGIAVSGMHYTGMAAMRLTPTGGVMEKQASVMSNYVTSVYIFIIASMILGLLLAASALFSEESKQKLTF